MSKCVHHVDDKTVQPVLDARGETRYFAIICLACNELVTSITPVSPSEMAARAWRNAH